MNQLDYHQVEVGSSPPELCVDISTLDVICGALASRDVSPLHHDLHYVTEQAGHRDIFINTPHQASLFERFLNDWSGPLGRLGRLRFTMKSSVYAGDSIRISGAVTDKRVDDRGCGWVSLKMSIAVRERVATECEARYALPVGEHDNPWKRRGQDWQP